MPRRGHFLPDNTTLIEHGQTVRTGSKGPTDYDAMITKYLSIDDYNFQMMRALVNGLLEAQRIHDERPEHTPTYSTVEDALARWTEDRNDEDTANLVKRLLRFSCDTKRKLAREIVDVMLSKWMSLVDPASDTERQQELVERQFRWLQLSVKMTSEGCRSTESEQHAGELIRLESRLPVESAYERDDCSTAYGYAQMQL